jgi:protein SCO1
MKRLFFVLLMIPAAIFAGEKASIYDLNSSWTNQHSESVNIHDLRGKPRVICMFFSNCSYACPRITADMKAIEAGLTPEQRSGVEFVMASFDVQRDVPAMLRIFAETKELGPGWQLLHGDDDAVRELAAALGVRFRVEPGGDFAHSNVITVLDAEGHIVHQREGLGGDLGDIIQSVTGVLVP